MNIRTLKIISIPIIASVNFVSGFLPYFFISRKIHLSHSASKSNTNILTTEKANQTVAISPTMKRFLTLANFFSAGVFLSTCIVGLYPGVTNKFRCIQSRYRSVPHYPYAGLSLAVGFFLVWLLEILVHWCLHCHLMAQGHSHLKLTHNSSSNHSNTDKTHSLSNNINNGSSVMLTTITGPQSSIEDRLLGNDEDAPKEARGDDHEPHSHMPISGNLMGSVMLTFALGSHSIIEGLGFGVLDEMGGLISMLITVLIHEAICAVSLGVNIASKRTPSNAAATLIAIFSILIPVGIGLGLALDSSIEKNNLGGEVVVAVLQGVAAGTFIYVVFMEILPSEMAHRRDAFLRLLMMVIGFGVIAAMAVSHSHHGECGSRGGGGNVTMNSTVATRVSSIVQRQ